MTKIISYLLLKCFSYLFVHTYIIYSSIIYINAFTLVIKKLLFKRLQLQQKNIWRYHNLLNLYYCTLKCFKTSLVIKNIFYIAVILKDQKKAFRFSFFFFFTDFPKVSISNVVISRADTRKQEFMQTPCFSHSHIHEPGLQIVLVKMQILIQHI